MKANLLDTLENKRVTFLTLFFLAVQILAALFPSLAIAQRASMSDIYGEDLAPGSGILQYIVVAVFCIGLIIALFVNADLRRIFFIYVALVIGIVVLVGVLVNQFGKELAIVISAVVGVVAYYLFPDTDSKDSKPSPKVKEVPPTLVPPIISDPAPPTKVTKQAEISVASREREVVYRPFLTFREKMERERRNAHIKTVLLKAAGILALFVLAVLFLYTLYKLLYSMFQ
jgi:hypothetical protein